MHNRSADFLRLEKRLEPRHERNSIIYEQKRESEYIPKYILYSYVVNLKKQNPKVTTKISPTHEQIPL